MVTDSTPAYGDQKNRKNIRVLPCPSVTGLLRVHPRPRFVFSRSHGHGFDAGVHRSEEPTEHPCPSVPSVIGLLRVHPRPRLVFSRSHRHGFDAGVQRSEEPKEHPCPSVPVRDQAFSASIRDLASCSVNRIITDSTPTYSDRKNRQNIRVLPCPSVTGLLRVHPRPRFVFSQSHGHGFDASERRSEEPTEHPCPSVPVRDRASPRPSATSSRVQSIASSRIRRQRTAIRRTDRTSVSFRARP